MNNVSNSVSGYELSVTRMLGEKAAVRPKSDRIIPNDDLRRLEKECADRFRREGADFDLADHLWASGAGWIASIKIVRTLIGCSIPEAYHTLIQNQEWLLYALNKANAYQGCANDASWYIKEMSSRSLIERSGKIFVPLS